MTTPFGTRRISRRERVARAAIGMPSHHLRSSPASSAGPNGSSSRPG